MTSPTAVADRRATVRRLAQDGASNRQIAAQLGICKDTVRRDLAQQDAPPATPAQRRAHRLAQAEDAVSQASAAAQAVADAHPAYATADDETARRWCGALRAAADALAAQADAFADYYPCATG
jgi:transposase-like protein